MLVYEALTLVNSWDSDEITFFWIFKTKFLIK
jgi:hypothetical protein